ncbi:MAG: helix-turn-helix domain-containing protein [Mediterranea sp.]|jgi:ribosomal protein L28|nr:helix-turn-helix domain-containing protein [Mediterranea sp.]
MKMITIDSDAYKMLVGKIDCIYQFVKNQTAPTEDPTLNPDEVWIDNDEAMVLLEVSGRTLQRLRSDGQITYFIKRHKVYYTLSEIRRLIHGRIVPAKTLPTIPSEKN